MILFATSIISLMIGLSVLSAKDKMGSKNWYFFMICISSSVWNFGYLLMEMAHDEADINLGRSLTLGGSLAASCLLIKFIYILIEGNSEKKSKITVIAVFLALIIFPLTGASDNTVITKTSYGVSYYLKENPITIISSIYGIATILLSLAITLKWIKVSKFKRDKFQGKVIASGIVFSLIGLLGGFFKLLNGEIKIPSSVYIFILIVIIYYFSKRYNSLSITVGNLAEYIYSSANTPILVLNDNKKVELVNSSAVKFFNITSEKLIGRDIEDIFSYKKDNINMFEINKEKNESGEYSFDSICLLNDAKCSISTTSIYDKYNEFVCAIFVITDLTDKMNLIEQLNESREEAVAANEAKSAFLANMSHEIRTPMDAIIGMSEIVLQKDVPKDIKENVINIRNSGKGLLTIINDILDLSKIESGKFEIIEEPYMLSSLLNDVFNIINIRLDNKPVELVVDINKAIPDKLIGDEIRIKQILINIMGNAVKFTKEGLIKLTIDEEKRADDFYLIMKVEDTGIGIKEEDINKLFGTFNQVDTRKNRSIQGTGLGLSISKNLSELMGGNITLESQYGKGTTFTIKVKQSVKDYTSIGEVKVGEVHNKQMGLDGLKIIPMPFAKILIVDDNEVNIQVAQGLMNPYGMSLDCAYSGEEAIDKIKETKYDLVFMDHMMPELDGVDTTKIIRNLEGEFYKEVPIVALTANAISEAKAMFLKEGFNDFLAKPIELLKLNLILKKWVLDRHNEDNLENNILEKNQEFNEKIIDIEEEVTQGIIKNEMEEEIEMVDSEIEGIDLSAGLNNLGGNMETYFSIIETYYRETKSKIEEINKTIENNNIQLFTTYVHGLKSSSGSIGAKKVADLAKKLEAAGKENNLEYINNNIDEFKNNTLKILENINKFINKKNYKKEEERLKNIEENEISNKEMVTHQIDKEILKKLSDSFEEVNLEDIENLLKEITKQKYDEKTKKLIKQIQQYLEVFEYDNSIQLIGEFLEEY